MEYTEHYAIAKHGAFGTGEALSAYSVINVAMDTIDDILWEHKGLIDALEERMTAVENRVTELENRMDKAEEDITNIYENIERIDQNIDNIEQNITQIEQNIDNIEENIDNIESNITNIEQNMETSNENIWSAITQIIEKVVGDNSVDENNGDVTWGITGNIAIGNMSLFGNSGMTSYIRARTGTGTNDVRAQ